MDRVHVRGDERDLGAAAGDGRSRCDGMPRPQSQADAGRQREHGKRRRLLRRRLAEQISVEGGAGGWVDHLEDDKAEIGHDGGSRVAAHPA